MVKILVVEDEAGMAFALETDFQTEGYEVAVVKDGEEAVKRAGAEHFDLILVDIRLRRKDGVEVCREIRRSGFGMPMIMLTPDMHETEKIASLGADDYVTNLSNPENSARESVKCFDVFPVRAARPEGGNDIHPIVPFDLDLSRLEL